MKGRNEKAAPGKVPARPGPFGVVPSRTPECIKCAADVKSPHGSRGAACAGLLSSQAGGGNLSKVGRNEKPRSAGLDPCRLDLRDYCRGRPALSSEVKAVLYPAIIIEVFLDDIKELIVSVLEFSE